MTETLTDLTAYLDLVKTPTIGRVSNPDMTYQDCLTIGNYWEDVAVQWLTQNGWEAERPRQKFNNPRNLPRLQRDIDVYAPDDNIYHIEVKSRRNPWGYTQVDVGKCRSWNAKEYPVSAVIVIDQETALAGLVAAGDSQEDPETLKTLTDRYTRANWVIRQNHDVSYSVPKDLFLPLETLRLPFSQ